jgi:hypothetical protein
VIGGTISVASPTGRENKPEARLLALRTRVEKGATGCISGGVDGRAVEGTKTGRGGATRGAMIEKSTAEEPSSPSLPLEVEAPMSESGRIRERRTAREEERMTWEKARRGSWRFSVLERLVGSGSSFLTARSVTGSGRFAI